MSGEYVVHATAMRDLRNKSEFIAARRPDSAKRFLAAAERAFRRLAEQPGLGGRIESGDPEFAGMRAWPIRGFRKFVIYSVPNPDGVAIVRVLHGAQDFKASFADDD